MRGFLNSFCLAVRQLWRAPVFSATVVLMLSAGVGATTAIFSLIEGVLLRPLPFRSSERLVVVGDHVGEHPGIGVTAREFAAYETAATAFSSIGGFSSANFELSGVGSAGGGKPEVVHAGRLEASVFSTLGVAPMLGRVFTREEDAAHVPLVVISYGMWVSRFHRSPLVTGSTIALDRKAYTVVGVMPRQFEFPLQAGRLQQAQLWVPMSLTAEELSEANAGNWRFRMVARLRDGVSLRQAAEDADRVAHGIMRNFPASLATVRIRGDVRGLREDAVGAARPLLQTLFAAVAIVLGIACVNVAILMLVRATRQRREVAVRLALGAGAIGIARQALAEGLLLSFTGGLLGLALAELTLRMALVLLPETMPRIDAINVDGVVAGFALLLGLATGALCSATTAFAAMRTNLLDGLRDSARTSTGGASHSWMRSGLVVAEIAIAMVLLTISVALLRSYQKMLAVDPGFEPEHAFVANYQLPLYQYATGASARQFEREVLERLRSQPGINPAGIASVLPATNSIGMADYTADNAMGAWRMKFAPFTLIYGDAFVAMGIPLRQGRYFTSDDRAGTLAVVIVNESMAKQLWQGQNAIGRRLHMGNPKSGLPWLTVVGVVADTRRSRDEPSAAQFYLPEEQRASLYEPSGGDKLTSAASGYIVLRSALPPEQIERRLRAVVAEVDSRLALDEVRAMTDALENIEAPRRFSTGLISAFAAGALMLAISGIYAVVAFTVTLRAREIAIRMALGAGRGKIARLVLLGSMKLTALGCGLGAANSVVVSGIVRSYLFEVTSTDPILYGLSAAVMLLLTAAASAVPAWRAAATDPIETLRAI